MHIKKGMFLKYKHSPDDVAIQVTRVLESTPNEVRFLGRWSGVDVEFVITKENESSWEIV